jgi:hypothetical protein
MFSSKQNVQWQAKYSIAGKMFGRQNVQGQAIMFSTAGMIPVAGKMLGR